MNTHIGSSGQAFDVFKLLIAAVVAAAILLMLLSVLNLDLFNPNQDPNTIAIKAVKDLKNTRGVPQFLDATFKSGSTLVANSIADKSDGLSSNQVCVLVSKNAANSSKFAPPTSGAEGKIIRYDGQSSQKTRLLIFCDRKSDIGEKDGSFRSLDLDSGDYDLSTNNCWTGSSASATVCLVAIVPEA